MSSISLSTLLGLIVGGAMALIGSYVAICIMERREKERRKERLEELNSFSGMTADEFRARAAEHWSVVREKQMTCQHEGYEFGRDGRCCRACGTMITDFGD